MNVRPYRLYGESELASAKESITCALDSWRRQWLLTGVSATVSNLAQFGLAGSNGLRRGRGMLKVDSDDRWCFFDQEPGHIRQLAAPLLSANTLDLQTVEGTIVNDVVLDALGELGQTLCGSIDHERREELLASSLPSLASEPGSGCLTARFVIGRDHIDCVLSPAAAETHLKRPSTGEKKAARSGELTPLRQAIGGQTVRLRARLAVADLALEPVISLREGDVIRLDERLEDPLTLICDISTLKCVGYLGVRNGHRAIRVTASGRGSGG